MDTMQSAKNKTKKNNYFISGNPNQDLFDRINLAGKNTASEWKYSPASQHLPQAIIRKMKAQ